MHEVGLMAEALRRAIATARQAGATRIERLSFSYDPTGHVTPEIIETLFMAMSDGTIAQGARLSVEPQDVMLRCAQCGMDFATCERNATCPACGGSVLPAIGTPELVLDSIDVDG